ncbi:hypothetical protein [Ancylobacter sp. SL191]|uniref:hypothetical protein n=1 Tax=Ancylobacter sp. SL191 TaxID=2995166 RepID=UPI00226E4903|nr:hypothetical protein [Ancylobacter sp. SL191]WAC26345.1 hypothetical protein OU996_15165 [Ancylobacter sp. SL191]
MAFRDCLATMVKAKEITAEEADELGRAYDRLHSAKARTRGPAAAAAEARDELAKRLEAEAAHRARVAELTAATADRVRAEVTGFRNWRGQADVAEATIRLLDNQGHTGYSSVSGRSLAITAQAHAMMEEVLGTFSRKWLTGARRNKARMENVLREARGEGTGDDAARALAQGWMRTSDWLRERFNAAGGAIGELKNWGLPQSHDRLKLIKAGYAKWYAAIRPGLDPTQMRHPLTGEPLTEAELDEALPHVFDSIVTEGWNTREPSRQPFGRGSLATQRADSRFLVFRDSESWLAYQREFGNPDIFATMMSHINLMARDVAALEILGPNPDATLEWLKQIIRQEAGLAQKGGATLTTASPLGAAAWREKALYQIDGIWGQLRGAAELPVRDGLASKAAAARNVIVAARLGGAAISAVTSDPITASMVAKFDGLNASRMMKQLAEQIAGGAGARQRAVRAGLVLDDALHVLRDSARWHGSLAGPEWSKVLPDRVLTWSGLAPWTQAIKHAFGREMQATAADQMGKAWADVVPEFRRIMEGYGIGEAQWSVMSRALPEDFEGSRFLRPGDIAGVDDAGARLAAERFTEMILGETERAIPSGTVRGRALMVGNSRPGTFWGEVTRSAAMFRSFGVSMALLQLQRLAYEIGGGRGVRGGKYLGGMMIALTLGGALALWMKDTTKGRDPQPADRMAFWLAAMAQGGGLGIFGDFLFSDANRFGNSLGSTLLGPGAALAADLWGLTVGNAQKALTGEETSIGPDVARMARNYVPGGNIWYLNAAYQRIMMDQLQEMLDPKAHEKFKRQVQNARREKDQGFWWAPGTTAPQRMPEMPFTGR